MVAGQGRRYSLNLTEFDEGGVGMLFIEQNGRFPYGATLYVRSTASRAYLCEKCLHPRYIAAVWKTVDEHCGVLAIPTSQHGLKDSHLLA